MNSIIDVKMIKHLICQEDQWGRHKDIVGMFAKEK